MEYLPDVSKLPIPQDDGACNHLLGEKLPQLLLTSTSGEQLELSTIQGKVVLYCYPMTKQLIKRLTLVSDNGKIVKVFYPVFPPDKNAEEVINWIKESIQ